MPGSLSIVYTLYLSWAESEADGPGQQESLASGLTGAFPNASSSSIKKVLIRDSLLCARGCEVIKHSPCTVGTTLHVAAAIKHKLIHGSLSNAFKGSFSVGFVLFSKFQSFLGNTISYPDVCARKLGCGWFGLPCLGRGAEKRGDPGILGLGDNEVFGESVFSPPLV